MTIAIGATTLSLVLVIIWMISLSLRKQRLEEEKKDRDVAYRKALEKVKVEEHQERLFKAETGHVPTLLYLAKEAERTDAREALRWYEKAAQLDNVQGMHGVVRICDRSKEDLALREKANFWQMCINAIEGDIIAKFDMGQAIVEGRGAEMNPIRGMAIIEEVAEEKYVPAMNYLADWLISDKNPEPNPTSSSYWYQCSADKNDAQAQMHLGLHYLNGIGVEKNLVKGRYWLECAAEKGHVEAMYHAGVAWFDVEDYGRSIAYIWLFLSAQFGYENAKTLRDQAGSKLGVDSVVSLQSLIKPIIKKLSEGGVVRHSIIKALNQLYKREVYFPEKKKSPTKNEVVEISQAEQSAIDTANAKMAKKVENISVEEQERRAIAAELNTKSEFEYHSKHKLDF